MPMPKIYKTAQEQLNEYVRRNEMRPSVVRNKVLELLTSLEQPFLADQLVELCQKERISVATVYNALNLFVMARILHANTRQRGRASTEYELITGKTSRMQIICTKCGRVSDIMDKAMVRLVEEKKYSNFEWQHFSLFVYGECKVCRQKRQTKTMKQ